MGLGLNVFVCVICECLCVCLLCLFVCVLCLRVLHVVYEVLLYGLSFVSFVCVCVVVNLFVCCKSDLSCALVCLVFVVLFRMYACRF